MAQNIELAQKLYYNYEIYRENRITHKRFKHSDILPIVMEIKEKGMFKVEEAGKSVDGKEIFLLSIGRGSSKIFLWSQMHGDEPTATMALLDVFNFFETEDDLKEIKRTILDSLTIFFMPMVNPDGAETYQRRNIFEIDINRDVNRKQTPEGEILLKTFEKLKPDFGFNLHDQSTRYAVGNSSKSAAIAFLAPSLDHAKSVDSVRENSMKLISELYKIISHFIPGHIAKYSDDYEPRAFGDNFQKAGTSTILIESGIWKNDPENQFIRKLNFLALISSFYSIASKSYKHEPIKTYELIPQNEERFFDLILRNVTYSVDKRKIIIDLGVNRNEVSYNDSKSFYYSSSVEDLGDLSVFYGFEDFDLTGYELHRGKTYPTAFTSLKEIKKLDFQKLYRAGYTNVKLKSKNGIKLFTDLPINIELQKEGKNSSNKKLLGGKANFVITKNGEVQYVIVNGFVVGVKHPYGKVINALVE